MLAQELQHFPLNSTTDLDGFPHSINCERIFAPLSLSLSQISYGQMSFPYRDTELLHGLLRCLRITLSLPILIITCNLPYSRFLSGQYILYTIPTRRNMGDLGQASLQLCTQNTWQYLLCCTISTRQKSGGLRRRQFSVASCRAVASLIKLTVISPSIKASCGLFTKCCR